MTIEQQIAVHCDEPEQVEAREYLEHLLKSDDDFVTINGEQVTLNDIITKYLDAEELQKLAIISLTGDHTAAKAIIIKALEEITL